MKNSNIFAAYDIGGTKCASLVGYLDDREFKVLEKRRFATSECRNARECVFRLGRELEEIIKETGEKPAALGISCGGPLNSKLGLIQSPPNLPGWDDIPICRWASEQTGLESYLENDANAGALAEWRYGAGRGVDNMLFLTFGTGLGAGVIIDGRLLYGASGNAGELGHITLADDGPVGYGKAGSFEGFCSGAGLARQMQNLASERLAAGNPVSWAMDEEAISKLDAKRLGELAREGDADALAIFRKSGEMLGRGLSIAIDLFNPEVIAIGSIFVRSGEFLRPAMEEILKKEALSNNLRDVKIVPAQLGESIGDAAALCAARENYKKGGIK